MVIPILSMSMFSYCLSIFIVFTTCPLWLSAQYFPESDAVWQGLTYGIAGPIPFRQVVCGDTMINNDTYQKIYSFIDEDSGIEEQQYLGAIRVAGPRVWIVEAGAEEEVILYDYTLEAGDQITLQLIGVPGEVTVKVSSVSTMQVDGEMVKVLEFVPIGGIEESWIEGIGSIRGPLFRSFIAVDGTSYLNCFRLDGELVYRTVPETECDFTFDCPAVAAAAASEMKPGFQLYLMADKVLAFKNPLNRALTLEAYSLDGRMIKLFEGLNEGQHQLNIGTFLPGLYLFRLKDTNKNIYLQHFKIVISE
jgi:hypothetical protein